MNISKQVYNHFVNLLLRDRRDAVYSKLQNKLEFKRLAENQKVIKKRIANTDDMLRQMKYDFKEEK